MTTIPRGVLSEKLQQAIRNRSVKAAVFLTFRFDPGFFEEEILPVVFAVPSSSVPDIRIVQLESELRGGIDVGVYYDKKALEAGNRPGRLDIERIGVVMRTGYFHPKVTLLLVENAATDEDTVATQSLIVMAASANLTRAGWWENVESAHIEEVTEGAPCSFKDDLVQLLRRVRKVSGDERHSALTRITTFLRTVSPDARTRGGYVLPRLYPGGTPFVDFLKDNTHADAKRARLEVISPYFDNNESMKPLTKLRDAFRPEKVRVFMPHGDSGKGLCSEEYYDAVTDAGFAWGTLPKDLLKWTDSVERRVHAKVVRITNRERKGEVVFIGSVNLTDAGFSGEANFEAGWVLDLDCTKPDWWLAADEKKPTEFMTASEDDEILNGTGWRLGMRCVWQNGLPSVTCWWEGTEVSPLLRLFAQGVPLFDVAPLSPESRLILDAEQSRTIADALRNSSFITVRAEGEEAEATILVQEDGMEFKPSVVTTFTSNDILKYWSALTLEQKKVFLEERADLFKDETIQLWLGAKGQTERVDKLFSAFAETYHSFSNLRKAVTEALEEGREKEARDRLFGKKFDSLRRLIERITVEESTPETLVERYVQLLCAKQLLRSVKSEPDHEEFVASNADSIRDLDALIATGEHLRDRFAFDDEAERRKFFTWFERWFLKEAEPLESAPC